MHKQDFPIFKTHPKLVYLDNAATSQKPLSVINAERDFYKTVNANVHRGIHALSEAATELYENSRQRVARFLNCDTEEIIFTSGTTLSLNMLALSLPELFIKPQSQDTILLTEMEHHSNLIPWQQAAKRFRVNLEFLKVTPEYRLDLMQLQSLLETRRIKILALTYTSNVLGTINPLIKIVKLVRSLSPETIVIVDGAQAVPHFPCDVKNLDIDFLAFSGHKILAPTGIGVLYGKKNLLNKMTPPLTGGGMINKVEKKQATWDELPSKFEAGTPNISGAIALATALDYLEKIGWKKIQEYEQELTAYALQQLKTVSGLKILGLAELQDRGSVISFSLKGIHPHDVAEYLDKDNIAVRAGHHCNQVLHQDVLHLPASVRASLYFYNDYQDIDQLKEKLIKISQIF